MVIQKETSNEIYDFLLSRMDSNLKDFNKLSFISINNDEFNKILKDLISNNNISINNKLNVNISKIENKINNISRNPADVFIALGFYNDLVYAPIFLIPVKVNSNILSKDNNRDIILNKWIINKYDLPNIKKINYISILKYIEDNNLNKDIYLANFNLNKFFNYLDLQEDNWSKSKNKLNKYINGSKDYYLSKIEVDDLTKIINWPTFNEVEENNFINNNSNLIKNLLNQDKSILYLGNTSLIKFNNDLDLLTIELSINISQHVFYNDLKKSINYNVHSFNEEKLDKLITSKEKLNGIEELIKKPFGNANLSVLSLNATLNGLKNGNFNSKYEFEINNSFDYSNEKLNNIRNQISTLEKLYSVNKPVTNNVFSKIIDSQLNSLDVNLFINSSKDLGNEFNELISMINDLNSKYGIKKLEYLDDKEYFSKCNILKNNPTYISNKNKINEFFKEYERFQTSLDNTDIFNEKKNLIYSLNSLKSKCSNHVDKLISISQDITTLNNILNHVEESCKKYSISIVNLKDYIEFSSNINIFAENPKLITDNNRFNEFVELIDKYNEINVNKVSSDNYLNQIVKNLRYVVDEIVHSFDEYIEIKNDYELANEQLLSIKSLNEEIGIKTVSLKYIDDNLDKINLLCEKPELYDDDSYLDLIPFLNVFTTKKFDKNIGNYLEQLNNEIISSINLIFDKYRKITSLKNNVDELNSLIKDIYKVSEDIGISINSYNDYLNIKDSLSLIDNNTQLINKENYDDFFNLLDDYEKINTSNKSARKFFDEQILDLEKIIKQIISKVDNLASLNNDFKSIDSSLDDLIKIKSEIGININNLNSFNQNYSNLKLLTKNPILIEDEIKLNDFVKDYESIIDLCDDYDAETNEDLILKLNSKLCTIQKPILDNISDILSSNSTFNSLLSSLYDLDNFNKELDNFNCNQIVNLSQIDEYIDNLKVLQYDPTFIKDYDDVESYFDIINYLKENQLIYNNDFIKDLYLKLGKMDSKHFSSTITSISEVIDEFIKFDKNEFISNLKTKSDSILDNINKLNVSMDILSYDNFEKYLNKLRKINNSFNNSPVKSALYEVNNLMYYVNLLVENSGFLSSRLNKDFKLAKNKLIKYYSGDIPNNSQIIKDYQTLLDLNGEYNKIYPIFKEYIYCDEKLTINQLSNQLDIIIESRNSFVEMYLTIADYLYVILDYNDNFLKNKLEYDEVIKPYFEKYLPNTFNGLESDLNKLNKEFENNLKYSHLLNEGFFRKDISDNLNQNHLNNMILRLKNIKNTILTIVTEIKNKLNYKSTFIENIFDIKLDDLIYKTKTLLLEIIDVEEILNKGSDKQEIEYIIHFNKIFSLDIFKTLINPEKYLDQSLKICGYYNLILNLNTNIRDKYFKGMFDFKNPTFNEIKTRLNECETFTRLYDEGLFNTSTLNYIEFTEKSIIEENMNKIHNISKKLLNILNSSKLKDFYDNDSLDYLKSQSLFNLDLTCNFNKISKELNDYSFINDTNLDITISNSQSAISFAFEKISQNNDYFDFSSEITELNKINQFIAIFDKIYKFDDNYVGVLKIINNSPESIYNLREKYDKDCKFSKLYDEGVFNENTINQINDNNISTLITNLDNIISNYKNNFNKVYAKDFIGKTPFDDVIMDNENNLTLYSKINHKMELINNLFDKNDDLIKNNSELINKILEFSEEFSILNISKQLKSIYSLKLEVNTIQKFENLLSKSKINFDLLSANNDDLNSLLNHINNSKLFKKYYGNYFNENTLEFINKSESYIKKQVNTIISLKNSSLNLLNELGYDDSELDINKILVRNNVEIKNRMEIEKNCNNLVNSLKENIIDVDVGVRYYYNILDDLFNLIDNHPDEVLIKYSTNNLSYIKNKLKMASDLYSIENSIDEYNDIIESHFKNIWDGYTTNIKLLKNKIHIDTIVSDYYNNKIINKTSIDKLTKADPKRINSEFSMDLGYYMRLYDEILGLSIYFETFRFNKLLKLNTRLINEINYINFEFSNYENKQFKDKITTLNNLFNNINQIIDINIDEYSSKINIIKKEFNKLEPFFNEYDNLTRKYSKIIYGYFADIWVDYNTSIYKLKKVNDINLEFTKLVDENFFSKNFVSKLKNNPHITQKINKIHDLNNEISQKLSKFNHYFKENYFSPDKSIKLLSQRIELFNSNLNNFDKWIELKMLSKSLNKEFNVLIDLLMNDKIDSEDVVKLFDYSFAKSYLNEIYTKHPVINELNIHSIQDCNKQSHELDLQIKECYEDALIETMIKKSQLDKKIKIDEKLSIKSTLSKYTGQIKKLKPIFITDMDSIYYLLDSTNFESYFDYVIIDKNIMITDSELISLLLRSKNKIIQIK